MKYKMTLMYGDTNRAALQIHRMMIMKFECLTPSQCGIGNDCSKCHENHVEKLDATIDKLQEQVKQRDLALEQVVEALEKTLFYTGTGYYMSDEHKDKYRELIKTVKGDE